MTSKCNALLMPVLLILLGWAVPVQGGITAQYTFDQPEIEQVLLGGELFDRVVMNNAPNAANTGEPDLPAIGARILIPYGEQVESVEMILGEPVFIGSNYYIEPQAEPVPLSKMTSAGNAVPPIPNALIYNSDQPFPAESFENVGVQQFRGYQILILKLQPMVYYPASGELYYYPDMQVDVKTVASSKESANFRGLAIDEQRVEQKVDNPELVSTYDAAPKGGTRAYDMLIITTPALAASFQPLKDYHDTTGILTEIHTTDDVGSSDPDDVRDYIADRYINDGIEWVIIGADDDIIPAKNLYVVTSAGGYTEYNMPSDIFFGCLDGTFNYDGDGYWGEPTDGDGGGDVDLIQEVWVGRASAGNTTEVDRFVTKTLWYVAGQHSRPDHVILVGEHLGFGGDSEYAAQTLDELMDSSSTHGYSTIGIPTDAYTIDRMYERDWVWPQQALIDSINTGIHILDHLGHGSQDYAMKLYNPDITGDLTNDDQVFVYSQTCLAGHFDGTDCWAETMNIKTDNGGWAVIMNARYGFGEYNSTDGPSQRFNREFFDAIFSPTEGIPELGRANQDSKEDNLYRINDGCMRWLTYGLNLFGDPTVAIMGVTGISFAYPDGVPNMITPGVETVFGVVVSGAGDGVPVSGTGELHYSVNGGAFQTVSMTESVPNEYEAVLPAINCEEWIDFYLSADEQTNGTMYDHLTSPYHAIPVTTIDTAFTDDFETDLGWTISGGLWARGVPTGGGGDYGGPDPTSGHSGSNVIGYNLNGDYTDNMPEYHITSPAIDCSGMGGVELRFWRWLGVEQPIYDHAYVRISTDGSLWTTVWDNGSEVTDATWTEQVYDISSYADGQTTVYIRFTMGTTDGGWTYCGWNVDDIAIVGYACEELGLTISTGTVPDWTVGQPYSQTLSCVNEYGNVVWVDRDDDLVGTGLSLSTDAVLSGTPSSTGVISFVAQVTDETPDVAEKTFTFTINPSVSITTSILATGTEGIPYSKQLETSGGTGTKTWTDLNDDLDGSGLSLSLEGVLAGTPVISGLLSFTAVATDVAGSQDQKALTANINPAVEVTTTSMPEAIDGQPYSRQLTASGGTGTIEWTEIGGGLSGTGLSLNLGGVVSGTVNGIQTINFTVAATGRLGSTDEQALSIDVVVSYTCGDVDGDGDGPDIEDLTFLVTYMFNQGPEPPVMAATDIDGNNLGPDVADLIYLVSYMFAGGPDPVCDSALAIPDLPTSKSASSVN